MFFWLIKRFVSILITPRVALRNLFFKKPSYKYSNPLNSIDFLTPMKNISDQYTTRFLLPKSVLKNLIFELKSDKYHKIFKDFNLKNPFVNYVVLYEIRALNDSDIDKSIYANFWHTDDSLNVGSIKIFQLPKSISCENGPMEFINKDDTMSNWNKLFFRGRFLRHNSQILKYTDSDKTLFLDPRSCLHRAGVPSKGNKRIMLMVQIIEKKDTENIDELFSKQYHKEPTPIKFLSYKS